jgi:hypothetical protein
MDSTSKKDSRGREPSLPGASATRPRRQARCLSIPKATFSSHQARCRSLPRGRCWCSVSRASHGPESKNPATVLAEAGQVRPRWENFRHDSTLRRWRPLSNKQKCIGIVARGPRQAGYRELTLAPRIATSLPPQGDSPTSDTLPNHGPALGAPQTRR